MAFTFKQLKQAKQNMIGFGFSPSEASHVLSVASPDVINAIIDGDMTQVSALLPQGSQDQAGKQDHAVDCLTKDQQAAQDQASPQASAGDCLTRSKDQGAQDQQGTAYTPQASPLGSISPAGLQDQARQNTSPQGAIYGASQDQESNKTPQHAGDCPQASQDRAQNKPAGVKAKRGTQGKEKILISRKQTSPQASATIHDQLSTLPQDQDITQALPQVSNDPAHMLPAGLYDDITATIDFYCKQNGITEPRKMHPHEWKSACIYIGQSIKTRNILQDTTRLKEGGFRYDPQKVLALLHLYDYTCGQYKQVPFEHNFARFAGVSMEYMRDYMQKGLTSTQVGLREKAHDIQTAGLIDGAAGGGSASVPMIFLCKALGGLSETVTVQHVSATASPAVSALPVFDDLGTLLPDNGGEK